jgi:hypothetical protein
MLHKRSTLLKATAKITVSEPPFACVLWLQTCLLYQNFQPAVESRTGLFTGFPQVFM